MECLSVGLPSLFVYLSVLFSPRCMFTRLPVPLFFCLPVYLSSCLSGRLFVFTYKCLSVTVCLSTCLSFNLSICLPVCLLTCLSVCSLVCPCLFTYFLLICLRVHPYLDVCLQYLLFIKIFSVHLFVCPFLLFVYLS